MYENTIHKIFMKMLEHEKNVPRRAAHFIKVYEFARMIALGEGIDEHTRFITECAALVHDIGIKPSLIKYNSSSGKYQEIEGVPEAQRLLSEIGIDENDIKRVCEIVGHHHTYDGIDGLDMRIVIEADFLVNLYEDMNSYESTEKVYQNHIKTNTGKDIFNMLYRSGQWHNT